ncbi:MAG: anthranilate phosphoribosyltransferase [Chloroflexi bacterium]|nr:anthranilate phosphoribosyltransferase [Chloroflexota bacterium]MDA1172940.1 anthranilate phosphoribosyltransferase [Chloroflexota bacterium]
MIQEALQKLTAGSSLSVEDSMAVAEEIMTGEATPAQIAGFLVALRMKGETVDEITGMAKVMREKSLHVNTDGEVLDVVGTGGDGSNTFNISTAALLVSAAAGVPVAKHGNRAASSKSGAADILEANGVKLELSPDSVRKCIDELNVGFMFAPAFHPAMRFAGPVRRELGLRTVFNILGPLTNPAGAGYQLLGVGFEGYAELMANVLASLGTKHSWVVRGDDGLDELTTTTTTQVYEVTGGRVRHFEVSPEDAGLGRVDLSELQATDSSAITALFHQSLSPGASAAKDIVMLNAAASMVVVGRAADLRAGVALARETIDSGEPLEKLQALAKLSQTLE